GFHRTAGLACSPASHGPGVHGTLGLFVAMSGDTEQEIDPEARRLAAAGAAMAGTRAITRCGRGQPACVLVSAGVGDWRHTPRHVRAVALVCRLSAEAGSLE